MTSWNTQCGISEYSRYLAKSLSKLCDLTILGSRNYDDRDLPSDPTIGASVAKVFDVELWNNYGHKALDVELILGLHLDVLHIQYECVLYNSVRLKELLEKFKGLKVVTYHDKCIPVDFPYQLFNIRYTHRDDTGVGEGYLIPYALENHKLVVKTFGLGRSRHDIIQDVCSVYGWDFQRSFGETNWRSADDLFRWLRDADCIVLWYDEVGLAGSSIAARVAISTRRPVVVNNTTWFQGLEPSVIPNLYKVETIEDLQHTMRMLLSNDYIEANSWDILAHIHIEDYINGLSRT